MNSIQLFQTENRFQAKFDAALTNWNSVEFEERKARRSNRSPVKGQNRKYKSVKDYEKK